jgi:MYXO-CTERM domain-containing protein
VTVPVDAGTDSGSTDAGGADASTHPDANKLDAAIDAATGHDAAVDSSPSSDASPFADAGKDSATPPTDAEAKHDSGSSDSGALANHDGSTGPSAGDASVDGADAGDAVGQTGGCGCRTAQPTKTPSSFGILAFLPLALAARRRSRRRSQRA